jgi:ketosteroid isomerase-like protein
MLRVLAVVTVPVALLGAAIIPGTVLAQTASQREAEAEVRRVIGVQQIAWNHGDIEGFMEGYWRSHDTVFVSGDDVTRGWQTVHDRYRSKYPDREKMGQLTFSELEVHMFGYDGAVAFGRWQLERATDKPHGRFTLIFEKTHEGWKIVHDHTSTAVDS